MGDMQRAPVDPMTQLVAALSRMPQDATRQQPQQRPAPYQDKIRAMPEPQLGGKAVAAVRRFVRPSTQLVESDAAQLLSFIASIAGLNDPLSAIEGPARAMGIVGKLGKSAAHSVPKDPRVIKYARNTERSQYFGSRFGQDIEPSGRYMIELPDGVPLVKGWEGGEVAFQNPLVIDWGDGYDAANSWKRILSERYGGKTGKALTNALRADGYDGIITMRGAETSEIVDLTADAGKKK